MTRHLKSKIKKSTWNCPVNEHWLSDSRFSKDGIEGITTPIITRGPISVSLTVDEELTQYQFEKIKKDSQADYIMVYNLNPAPGCWHTRYA